MEDYETPQNDMQPSESHINETVIVPTPHPAHTDTYIPDLSAAGAGKKTEEEKKPRTVRFTTLILFCLLCSLLTGGVVLFGSSLLQKQNKNGDAKTSLPSRTVVTSTDNAQKENQEVTINVQEVHSPATAVSAKVLPSVVGVQVTAETVSWFGRASTASSEGSGVIFSEDGYVITNYHVIEYMLTAAGEESPNSALNIYLYTDPETAIPGSIVGYDISADLAVLKIDKKGLTAIELGNSDSLLVGDIAIALGNPGGLQFLGSVTQGIISGLNRTIQSDSAYEDLKLIQTDAAINPGNSGGALVDTEGRLIGINSMKFVSEGYESMGFAIPVNDVIAICNNIIRNGYQKIAYFGVELNENYTAATLERLGYPGGILIDSVVSGSPAEAAGIRADDILISFNGVTVTTADDLKNAKASLKAGDTVPVRLYRLTSRTISGRWKGEYLDISVTLG